MTSTARSNVVYSVRPGRKRLLSYVLLPAICAVIGISWRGASAAIPGWCTPSPPETTYQGAENTCLNELPGFLTIPGLSLVAPCRVINFVPDIHGGGVGNWAFYVHYPTQPPGANYWQAYTFWCLGVAYDPDKNFGPPCKAGTCTGDPINAGTGSVYLEETDLRLNRWLRFTRYYNSGAAAAGGLGTSWRHTYARSIDYTGTTPSSVVARSEDGSANVFTLAGGQWSTDADVQDRLTEQTDGSGNALGWTLFRANTRATEHYDQLGKLTVITDADGFDVVLTYSTTGTPPSVAPGPGFLLSVTDPGGRALQFSYTGQGTLSTLTDPAGQAYHYALSADGYVNLGSVTFPGGGYTRTYLYGELAHTQNTSQLSALTSVVDENAIPNADPYTTFDYDASGNAIGTQHANGTDHFVLTYNSVGPTDVQDPNGNVSHHTFSIVNGVVRAATVSSPSRGFTIADRQYDSSGNVTSATDFNGNSTCSSFDQVHGLVTSRVEGVVGTCTGSPIGQRTVETDWDTNLRMQTERRVKNASNAIESLSKWIYNTRGQVTARCQIDNAVSGASSYTCGSATNAVAGVRQVLTTYCEASDVTAGACPLVGLVKSVNGARLTTNAGMGGLDDTTLYTYRMADDATCATSGACTYRKGDLWKITNALLQVTEYVSYDKNGRVTRTKDANGTYTDFTYHARGWLTDRSVRASASGTPGAGDATMHIDYDAVGNVTKVTQPDGAYLQYTYDDAHRLLKINDNLANKIDYCPGGVGNADCLDAAGNRKVEQVKDPSNAVKRQLHRVYNQLGQLTQVLNAANAAVETSAGITGTGITDGYDGNGNRILKDDGLGIRTEQDVDPLNRLKTTIQNVGGTDTATQNTTTGYTYDTRDNLRQVADPDGLNTIYDYDNLNNLTGLHSPDTGTTGYTYDVAGNRISQTDNRTPSVTSTYTYDPLNRLTAIGYPTTSLNVTYAYDQADGTTGCSGSFSKGHLTRMTDASGSTTYCYDRRGNVTKKTQVTGGTSLVTEYAYTVADRLTMILYPSGAVANYTRDALGRITGVQWAASSTAKSTTLVSNATYYPFGPLNVLTFGNGRTLTKTYDQDYAIDSIGGTPAGALSLDLGVDVMGDIVGASGTMNLVPPDRVYQYDPLYRLKTAQTGTTSPLEAYTYNKTGDRLSASLNGGAASTYTYAATTHHLASVGGVARTYDGNGNTLTGTSTGLTLGYDDRNRLATAVNGTTSATYAISGRGERVGKTVTVSGAPTTTLFAYDEGGRLIGEYSGTGVAQAEYIYLDSIPVGVVKGGVLYYIETDHLGTPRHVVKPTGNVVVWKWDFLQNTFGNSAPNQDPDGDSVQFVLGLRFPGQYADGETALSYNKFRDYQPSNGRYVQSDPVGLTAGPSTFGYVASRPMKLIDPFGLKYGCPGEQVPIFLDPNGDGSGHMTCVPDPGMPPQIPACAEGYYAKPISVVAYANTYKRWKCTPIEVCKNECEDAEGDCEMLGATATGVGAGAVGSKIPWAAPVVALCGGIATVRFCHGVRRNCEASCH